MMHVFVLSLLFYVNSVQKKKVSNKFDQGALIIIFF